MPNLYIVATPIGNLKDITLRALETLKSVDFILCEDTRVTKKLLSHYEIKKPLISYHHHSSQAKAEEIISLLKDDKDLALVTDAGTPGISDPGNELISVIVKELGEGVDIVPLPGPSAVVAAASVSGLPMNEFLFLGYPPAKNKRKAFFARLANSDTPVILYESPHRIIKTLQEIKDLGVEGEVFVARELTKKFETKYRGNIDEVLEKVKKDKVKGEFVIIWKSIT